MPVSNAALADAPAMQRAFGVARLGTQLRGRQTRLQTLYQEGCCKIRLPRVHGQALEAVLINTSGGLTSGDAIRWEAEAVAGAKIVLTTQACERAYRATSVAARIDVELKIGLGGHIDWLPQETILFEDSRLERHLDVHLEDEATFTAIEAVLLGREAMGEMARRAQLRDRWRVWRNGRLLHAEATHLSGADFERDGLSLLSGHNAFATILAVTPDAAARLEGLRADFPSDASVGASVVGERLILRATAPSGIALRRILAPAIEKLSGVASLPRMWTI